VLLDLKAACRELAKNRWFTCVTVLTLALGIGANTAIFAVVNKLLLNLLPYADSDRLLTWASISGSSVRFSATGFRRPRVA
jgi:putative ABC transport system permease protein